MLEGYAMHEVAKVLPRSNGGLHGTNVTDVEAPVESFNGRGWKVDRCDQPHPFPNAVSDVDLGPVKDC